MTFKVIQKLPELPLSQEVRVKGGFLFCLKVWFLLLTSAYQDAPEDWLKDKVMPRMQDRGSSKPRELICLKGLKGTKTKTAGRKLSKKSPELKGYSGLCEFSGADRKFHTM